MALPVDISACYEYDPPEVEPDDDTMDTCYLHPIGKTYVFNHGDTIMYKKKKKTRIATQKISR